MNYSRLIPLIALTASTVAQPSGNFTFDRLVERHDRNGDGVVTKDEFKGNARMFEFVDTDKDGAVTRAEFDAALEKRKNRTRPHGRFESARDRFSKQGPQPGRTMPDLQVYDLEGKPVALSSLWKDKPALIVTASVTCPISVRSCPTLKELSSVNANYVNTAVLYIREAHPAEGDAESEKAVGARSHPQPATFAERLELARLFNEKVAPGTPVFVDGIDNAAAKAPDAGPNIGLLVNTDGRIINRQGWFDAKTMAADFITFDGAAQEPVKRNPLPAFRAKKIPAGVTVLRDVEYAEADGQSLQLDLYLPEKTDQSPPLLVWIHGGGWRNGDKANVNPAILQLTGDGYAVASINYRLKDLSIHPKNIHDCKGAVRWLRAHAEEYGYNPERIAVGGSSAGGHLSLLLGLSGGVQSLEGTVGGNTNRSSQVKAIVDFYGPSDFMSFSKNSERFNRAHEFQQEQLKDASPTTYLDKGDPPVLILHGDADKTVPVQQSILLDKRCRETGIQSELHIIPEAGHGGKVFSKNEYYQLIKAFLDKNLRDK